MAQAPRSQCPAPPLCGAAGDLGGLAAEIAGDLIGKGDIKSEKETMQCLNDCLASSLERVGSQEADNRRLGIKVWEHLEKKGPQVRDWGHYFKTIGDLRAQIFANSVDNAHIILQIDNAHLAVDVSESSMRWSWPCAICGE